MKKILVLAILVVTTMATVFGQNALTVLEREIARAETELKKAEKNFESQKTRKISELKSEVRKQEILAKRADDASIIDAVAVKVAKLNHQIDSVSALKAEEALQGQTKKLYDLQQKKNSVMDKLLADTSSASTKKTNDAEASKKADKTASDPAPKPAEKTKTPADSEEVAEKPINRTVPVEVSRYEKNRRSRANVLRVDEVLIAQVENNMNATVRPAGQPGGFNVVFDNMYTQPVNFIVKSANGGMQRVSVMLDSKVRCEKNLLPGNYVVEFYVNGKLSGQPRPLKIDGQPCDYNGYQCYGYVYMPRF